MTDSRSQQWRRRIDRLHERVSIHRRARRYDAAQKAQVVLRDTYDRWAREVDYAPAA